MGFCTEISLLNRIKQIVDHAYLLLCNKITQKDLVIHNEASLQLYLGVIMQQIGVLYQFSPTDHFVIELESPEEIGKTQKSSNGKARCDIKIVLSNGISKAEAFIELKFFKKHFNGTVTNNKFSLYCDIENLEKYLNKDSSRICYEILYTDNFNYTIKNNSKFCIGDGHTIIGGQYQYTRTRNVKIQNNYTLNWDIYAMNNNFQRHHCFLKIPIFK